MYPFGQYLGNVRLSYLLQDLFSTDLPAGSLNATNAEPGPGVRTVIDTENKESISANQLTFSGGKTVSSYTDPRMNYPAQTRIAGRTLFFDITLPAINTFIRLGWATTVTDFNGEGIILFNNINCMVIIVLYLFYCLARYLLHITHMKRNNNKYQTVTELPANAKSVAQYAKDINCTSQNIYMRLMRGVADYTIVIFEGFNFVIPNN